TTTSATVVVTTASAIVVTTIVTTIATFVSATCFGIGCLTDIWRQVTFTVNFAFTDPNFHTDLTVSSQGFCQGIVDICTECMQRDSSFFVLLGTCHFSTTKASRTHDLDTFSTHAHGRSDR